MASSERRLEWRNALWEAPLSSKAKLVGLAYEKYAGNGLDGVWVHGELLRQLTGYSRDTANRALRELEEAGWLIVVAKAKQHRSTRYALRIPADAQQSDDRNASVEVEQGVPASVLTLRTQRSDSRGPAFRSSETNSDPNPEVNSCDSSNSSLPSSAMEAAAADTWLVDQGDEDHWHRSSERREVSW